MKALFKRFEELCQQHGEDPAGAARDLLARGQKSSEHAECLPSPQLAPSEDRVATAAACLPDWTAAGAGQLDRSSLPEPDLFLTEDGYPAEQAAGEEDGLYYAEEDDHAQQQLGVKQWLEIDRDLKKEVSALEQECQGVLLKQPRPGRPTEHVMSMSQFRELHSTQEELREESQRWSQNIFGTLGKLRKRVAALRQNSIMTEQGDHLQVLSKGLERDLEVFKAQQRQEFHNLAFSEPDLEENLLTMGRRFQAWAEEPSFLLRLGADATPSTSSRSPLRKSSDGSQAPGQDNRPASEAPSPCRGAWKEDAELQKIKAEIAEVDAEVQQSGGEHGGWSSRNHELFVRIFRMFKFQATPTCYARLEERFPGVSEAELADHVRWFARSEAMQAKRRVLLARWRERRMELDKEAEPEDEKNLAAQRRKAEEKDQRQRAEQRRKVAEWRQNRAEEEQRALALQQSLEQEQARQEKERFRQQQKSVKETAEAYRRQRELERQAERQAERGRARSASSQRNLSQEDRQRIAQRNLELLRKKLSQAPPPRPRQESPVPHRSRAYDHVESRLYGQTESFVQKITSKVEESSGASAFVNGEDLPHFNRRSASQGPPPRFPQSRPPPGCSALGQAAQAVAAAKAARGFVPAARR